MEKRVNWKLIFWLRRHHLEDAAYLYYVSKQPKTAKSREEFEKDAEFLEERMRWI